MPESSPDSSPLPRRFHFVVDAEQAGERLDRYLSAYFSELSRTRLQNLIDEARVLVGGAAATRAYRVEAGDTVTIEIPPLPENTLLPETMPLEILYEDEDLVVVNKPAGMAVHPGAGRRQGTLVNALLARIGQLSSVGGPLRPGIVHRLDKDTSGALVVARNDQAHCFLVEQFRQRRVEKTYLALLHGRIESPAGKIVLPVARDLQRRVRMTTRRREGREARTDWRTLLRIDGFTLIEAKLHTGRTHQIRVHFSSLGHPVVGDTLYGAPRHAKVGASPLPPLERNFLHAARIGFTHPRLRSLLQVRAPLPQELVACLRRLEEMSGLGAPLVDAALREYL